MTGAAFIDMMIEEWLDIGGSDANDAAFRARVLRHLKRRAERMRSKHPWPWRMNEDDVTITGDSGPLPADFQSWGKHGIVTLSAALEPNPPLVRKDPQKLLRMLRNTTATSTRPRFYAEVLGRADARTLYVFPAVPSTIVVNVVYDSTMPEITDVDAAGGLEDAIPAQYHETVLYDGVMAGLMKDEGDDRWTQQEQVWMLGIAEAWKDECPRNEARRVPLYGRTRR